MTSITQSISIKSIKKIIKKEIIFGPLSVSINMSVNVMMKQRDIYMILKNKYQEKNEEKTWV